MNRIFLNYFFQYFIVHNEFYIVNCDCSSICFHGSSQISPFLDPSAFGVKANDSLKPEYITSFSGSLIILIFKSFEQD